jgi:hypothetical protein
VVGSCCRMSTWTSACCAWRSSVTGIRLLDIIEGVPADVLLPGHGAPWTGGATEADRRAGEAGPA